MEDSKDPSEDKKDLGEELSDITREEENIEYVESIDTCHRIAPINLLLMSQN